MEKQGKWLLCPNCHGKTRIWLREDTILSNFLLFVFAAIKVADAYLGE